SLSYKSIPRRPHIVCNFVRLARISDGPCRSLSRTSVAVVVVVVPPRPIFFLLLRGKPAEIAIRVAVGFGRPLPVVNGLVMVPDVIVGVIRIVDAVIMVSGASDSCDGR